MAPAASSTAAPQFYRAAVVGGLLGLAMATAAVTMAVSEPPPWLRRDAYLAAVAGAFLAGVALVAASVWAADARAAPEFQKQQQQPAFDLERVHGGLLGLAMASSAITLVVSEPLPWLHDHRDAYLVALAAAFFAGVTLVAVSVVSVDAGPSSPRADDVGLVRR